MFCNFFADHYSNRGHSFFVKYWVASVSIFLLNAGYLISWAFIALILYLNIYAALSSARLHGANYLILTYSIYRGFIFF